MTRPRSTFYIFPSRQHVGKVSRTGTFARGQDATTHPSGWETNGTCVQENRISGAPNETAMGIKSKGLTNQEAFQSGSPAFSFQKCSHQNSQQGSEFVVLGHVAEFLKNKPSLK